MDDVTKSVLALVEQRAAGYGDLRKSSLTAIALDKAADTITRLSARVEELEGEVIAFGGPWAAQYAKDYGLPDGTLHPVHYDILAKAGARMEGFQRGDA